MTKRFRSRWRSRLLLLLGALLASLIVLEIGMRIYVEVAGNLTVLQADERLGWRLVPGAHMHVDNEVQAYSIAVNSRGLRDRETTYERSDGTYRALLLGDSFTFATGGVDYGSRFSELLESRMTGLEVVNAGVPGFSVDQEYLWFIDEGIRYSPDLVMVCLYWNDDLETFVANHPKIARSKPCLRREGDSLSIRPPQLGIGERYLEYSRALSWIERRLATLTAKRRALPEREIENEERLFCFEQLVRLFERATDKLSADLAFVYLPHPWDAAAQPNVLQFTLAETCAASDCVWLDLTPVLGPDNPPQPAFFPINGHLNEYGHELTADALETAIRSFDSWNRFTASGEPLD